MTMGRKPLLTMRTSLHVLSVAVALLLLHGCSFCSITAEPNLEEQTECRKAQMLDNVQQCHSNAEKGEFIVNATHNLDDVALSIQCKIENILHADILEAYQAERESFSAWYAFQQTMAEEVIGNIWELYVGGSAGGSFQTIHLYDIANTNTTEQAIIYNAISKKSYAKPYLGGTTLAQIDSVRKELAAEIHDSFSLFNDVYQDSWPNINNTPTQISELIDRDIVLFKQWISDRNALEPLLNERVRKLYASNTTYWKHLCFQKYTEHFISK